MRDFASYISLSDKKDSLVSAKRDVLRFENTNSNKLISFYADIYNFISLLLKYTSDPSEKQKVAEIFDLLKSNIEKDLVISNIFLNSNRTGKNYLSEVYQVI